jgi:hypothetical protein
VAGTGRIRAGPALAAAAALAACAPEWGRPGVPQGPEPAHVLHTLPAWAPMGGITLGRDVFLKRSQQNAIGIGHELVHVRQQAERPLWFWVSYATSPRWRLRWEAEAYAVQARAGCPIEGEHGLAAYLSGRAYLWTATRDEARREILRFR